MAETDGGEAGGPAGGQAGGAAEPGTGDPSSALRTTGRPGRHVAAGNSSIGLQAAQPPQSPSSTSMVAAAAPSGGLARKRQVMDHFLLALRSSELARVVDPGTLHYWLDSTFQDHTRGGSLQLQGLFSTLLAEPGVEARMVAPPLLALKSWEAKVGMRVNLPAELEALTEVERKQHLARFPVQPGDVDRLLGRVIVGLKAAPRVAEPEPAVLRGPKLSAAYADPAAAARAALQEGARTKGQQKQKKAGRPMSKARRTLIIGAFLAMPLVLGTSIYLTLRPVPILEIDASAFASTGVPVTLARRKATVVVLTVGPAFATLSRQAQVAATERALRVATEHGASGIHLIDAQGQFLLSKTDLIRMHR